MIDGLFLFKSQLGHAVGEEALNFIDWIDVCCASSQGLAPYVVPKTGVRYPILYSHSWWLGSKIQGVISARAPSRHKRSHGCGEPNPCKVSARCISKNEMLCVPFAMSEQEARISAAKHMVIWHTLRFSGWHDSTEHTTGPSPSRATVV